MFAGPAGRVRWAAAACLIAVAPVSTARAQAAPAPASHAVSFVPRTDFSFSFAGFRTPDPRFTWDARLRLDADLVDYGTGRFNMVVDYEGVLGSELKRFDLNHGNYALDAALSQRLGAFTVAALFHHVSRHLSDRANLRAISWNVVGVEAERPIAIGKAMVNVHVDAGQVRGQHYVDYQWTTSLRLGFTRPLTAQAAIFARATGGFVGVDPAIAGRVHRLCGASIEAGLKLNGRDGGVELFAGYERRIDAYPLDRGRVRLVVFGFRIVSR